VTEARWLGFSFHSRRSPVTLALLTGLAIIAFGIVGGLSRLYHAQQDALADRWAQRGSVDLHAGRFNAAAGDFRAALLYSRDSYANQLSLAEALIGLKKIDEASVYLTNLWDREPENGVVNLDLARIASAKNDTTRALRFYHNAIYATWPGDQEKASRNSRLELIDYLLRINANTQAQAELLALEANLPEGSPEQEHLGELFMRAQDAQHALATFKLAAAQNKQNHTALLGAGVAAFRLGLYPTAKRYLQDAVAQAPGDAQSAEWLRKTNDVLALDPYRRQVSSAERASIATSAFAVAGARLKACAQQNTEQVNWQDLEQQWNRLKPQVTPAGLRRNADMINTAMDLAVNIESKTNGVCGSPTEADTALLLVANLHEEN
jgi:tetratricopeptide (TPR) repeat protein